MRGLLFLVACLFSGSANAAVYSINLNTVTPTGIILNTLGNHGGFSPAWSFAAQAGDIFDFGSVDYFPVGGSDPRTPPDPIWEWIAHGSPTVIFGQFTGPMIENVINYPCLRDQPCIARSTNHYELQYTIPDGVDLISIGFDLPHTYMPPAVPEISTWAMLLIGFAGTGFAGYRRSKLHLAET
jgi:hypothetical protein